MRCSLTNKLYGATIDYPSWPGPLGVLSVQAVLPVPLLLCASNSDKLCSLGLSLHAASYFMPCGAGESEGGLDGLGGI